MTPPSFLRLLPALALALAAPALAAAVPAVLIFGEQHDQPDQQRQVAAEVRQRAAAGTLAAVVIEMAERGRDTRALAPDATPERVREALAWAGWPWDAYAEVVMHAVRAGVPVHGGNLPRTMMRAAMHDAGLDARVSDAVREQLTLAVRHGHCELLPREREPGMVRIQIARDRALAATVAELAQAAAPGRSVLLLTGAQHASRDRGVPLHLPPGLGVHVVLFGAPDGLHADERRPAVLTPRPDPCEALREQLRRREPTR
jgi:uncharacterized iron-regulated protein